MSAPTQVYVTAVEGGTDETREALRNVTRCLEWAVSQIPGNISEYPSDADHYADCLLALAAAGRLLWDDAE
jgi:hypothetical protein